MATPFFDQQIRSRAAMPVDRAGRPAPVERARQSCDPNDRIARPAASCLSIHAGYLCQHAGACCTAGWHVAAEPEVVAAITVRFGSAAREPLLLETPASPDAPAILAAAADGACVFFDTAGDRSCTIHDALGEAMLPSACRQFPRVTLTDARGTRITLSHFCPTAAALLFVPMPLRIVPAPARLSLSGSAEGLDATAVLPPLLRPGMLMDLDGYAAWEQKGIEWLDSGGPDADAALAALLEATRLIREWAPGHETLRDSVTRVMDAIPCPAIADDPRADARRHALAVASVPPGLAVPDPACVASADRSDVDGLWHEFDGVIRRYLAAKLFAAWWPYLGLDLMAVVEAIQVHRAVLRRNIARRAGRPGRGRDTVLEAIRDTDWLMVHLSDSRALARLITQES